MYALNWFVVAVIFHGCCSVLTVTTDDIQHHLDTRTVLTEFLSRCGDFLNRLDSTAYYLTSCWSGIEQPSAYFDMFRKAKSNLACSTAGVMNLFNESCFHWATRTYCQLVQIFWVLKHFFHPSLRQFTKCIKSAYHCVIYAPTAGTVVPAAAQRQPLPILYSKTKTESRHAHTESDTKAFETEDGLVKIGH